MCWPAFPGEGQSASPLIRSHAQCSGSCRATQAERVTKTSHAAAFDLLAGQRAQKNPEGLRVTGPPGAEQRKHWYARADSNRRLTFRRGASLSPGLRACGGTTGRWPLVRGRRP